MRLNKKNTIPTVIFSAALIILFQNCSTQEAFKGNSTDSDNTVASTPELPTTPEDLDSPPVSNIPEPTVKIPIEPTKNCNLTHIADPQDKYPTLSQDYQCVTIEYDEHENHTYDLWFPKVAHSSGKSPVVIYTHGGGYRSGDKIIGYQTYIRMEDYLKAGFVFATINYRLSPDVPYKKSTTMPYPPAMIDAASALQDIKFRATHYGYDANKIALTGVSAGGGISLWVALHDDLQDPVNIDPRPRQSTRVSCVAVAGAQTTLGPDEAIKVVNHERFELDGGLPLLYGIKLDDYNLDPDRYEREYAASMLEASPITHVSSDDINTKFLLSYSRDYNRFNIHSPEFGRYMATGVPDDLSSSYNRKSFDDYGIEYELKVNQGKLDADMDNVFDFITQSCYP